MLLAYAYQEIPLDMQKKVGIEDGVYVVAFFASWCHSCQKELPKLQRLYQKGIKIVGVDVDEDLTKAKNFQQSLHLTFPVINDTKGKIIEKFNPIGIPAIYIIKNKKIAATLIGAHENIDAIIVHKLKELQ